MDTRLIVLVLLAVLGARGEQLVCYSRSLLESQAIYSFFHEGETGRWIDLNAEHSVLDSNTIYLRSQGWTGINVVPNSQILAQFQVERKDDINVQLDQSQNFSQLCQTHLPSQAQFLSSSTQNLDLLLKTNDWSVHKCKSELMLIKQYDSAKVTDKMKDQLKQFGYEQVNSYQNFVIFVLGTVKDKYRAAEEKNKGVLGAKKLVGLSTIVRELGEKVLGKPVELKDIKGSTIAGQMSIVFARRNQILNLASLPTSQAQKPSTLLLMEYHPQKNALILPENSYKSESLPISSQNYTHVSYKQASGEQLNIYIFDHGHEGKGSIVQSLEGLKVKKFDGSEIKDYDLAKIDQLRREAEKVTGKGDAEKDKEKLEMIRKELEKRLKDTEAQLELKQKELLDATRQKKQAMEKELQTEKQLQQQKKKQSAEKRTKTKPTTQPPQLNPQTPTPTPTSSQPPQDHVSYLTPENLLANKNIHDTTIMVIILVCSIFGSIFLTAVVTACIMKRRHKAHVRRRIKNNADMHSDIQTEHSTEGQKVQTKSEVQM